MHPSRQKEAVLRTGCLKTICHPFQVHVGVPAIDVGDSHFPCTVVYRCFCPDWWLELHSSKRTKTLTNYLSSRLTPDEEELIKARAAEAGISRSEWCRKAILGCLDMPLGDRLILEELMALRKIILALKVDDAHALPLSEDRLRFLIEQAETTKAAMAQSRIHSIRSKDLND